MGLSLLMLLACGQEPALEGPALARRISLDLRGVPLDEAELAELTEDPSALDGMVDAWLEDPRFPERVMELYAPVWRTRTEHWTVDLTAVDRDMVDPQRVLLSLGEEPLRLLAALTEQDLPYTTLVTADWTMADEITAALWPIERPEGDGWLRSRYTDGRPAAGVLSSNTMWWRYTSSESNANRARANAISRILLCHDYTKRPVEATLDVAVQDDAAIRDAVREDPGCVSCHSSLDPMASALYGFFHLRDSLEDAARYHPERERLWEESTGAAPAFDGAPVADLSALGRAIAADERFARCAVQTGFEAMVQRPATLEDQAQLTEIRERFLAGGLTVRALMRAVVDSPAYRSAGDARMLTPEQLARVAEQALGYGWRGPVGQPLLATDVGGFHSLAGGDDGASVFEPARSPTAGLLLTSRRLAEVTAGYAVDKDIEADEPRLFTALDGTPEGREAQVRLLLRRLHGVEPEAAQVEAALALYDTLAAQGPEVEAWTGVLTGLLLSPEVLLY
ncbi:MAG: DUF1585 domain-containing protein [Alphaproteobacteria bacterium]|nr:DUF1585 domain-containing protein [Alphaproteobacteria bacterium]MCB9796834.1 DUF1585 domain-containing protein [Alphaproteobacteria bacterium]